MSESDSVGASGAFPTERARKACEERQSECPHEWALSTQRNGLLVWRFHQDDCPRCLKMWMNYWRGRAKGAEGSKTIIRRCRCPFACEVHRVGTSGASAAESGPLNPSSEVIK